MSSVEDAAELLLGASTDFEGLRFGPPCAVEMAALRTAIASGAAQGASGQGDANNERLASCRESCSGTSSCVEMYGWRLGEERFILVSTSMCHQIQNVCEHMLEVASSNRYHNGANDKPVVITLLLFQEYVQ